jgi:hypothetical protein
VHPALPGKFRVLSEEEQRCESPVSMFECNGWCRDRERDGERNDTDAVKPDVVRADVVSLASCKDPQLAWEADGVSMTSVGDSPPSSPGVIDRCSPQSLVDLLRENPHQSLKDVLIRIRYAGLSVLTLS